MPTALRLFTDGFDAETALIKSILERHGFAYAIHDVSEEGHMAKLKQLCGENVKPPVLLVGRHKQWSASMLPELERSGELVKVLKRERELAIARAEYKFGMAYLNGKAAGKGSGPDQNTHPAVANGGGFVSTANAANRH